MCYLADFSDSIKLLKCIKKYILENNEMRENDINHILLRLKSIFGNKIYRERIEHSSKSNWIGIKYHSAFDKIINRVISLQNEQF